jgi:3'(2'), 5'-bisphosphate nucleotidase
MEIYNKLRHFEFVDQIIPCLEHCGQKIMDIYDNFNVDIQIKEDQSPLTQADLISHQLINECLQSTAYPVISEESEKIYTNAAKYWLVDPLDGTKEFINKNGEFTVNIALIENRYPIAGYVYSPTRKSLYVGGIKKHSFKIQEGVLEQIQTSPVADPIRIVASRSHLNEETKKYISQFPRYELLQSGSSIKLCMVAEGKADLYPRFAPTSEWDTAAAQAVVEGAGGTVQDTQGERLIYQKDQILNPHFIVKGN